MDWIWSINCLKSSFKFGVWCLVNRTPEWTNCWRESINIIVSTGPNRSIFILSWCSVSFNPRTERQLGHRWKKGHLTQPRAFRGMCLGRNRCTSSSTKWAKVVRYWCSLSNRFSWTSFLHSFVGWLKTPRRALSRRYSASNGLFEPAYRWTRRSLKILTFTCSNFWYFASWSILSNVLIKVDTWHVDVSSWLCDAALRKYSMILPISRLCNSLCWSCWSIRRSRSRTTGFPSLFSMANW